MSPDIARPAHRVDRLAGVPRAGQHAGHQQVRSQPEVGQGGLRARCTGGESNEQTGSRRAPTHSPRPRLRFPSALFGASAFTSVLQTEPSPYRPLLFGHLHVEHAGLRKRAHRQTSSETVLKPRRAPARNSVNRQKMGRRDTPLPLRTKGLRLGHHYTTTFRTVSRRSLLGNRATRAM